MALRFAADNRQQTGGVHDASVSGNFFGLGEDAEHANQIRTIEEDGKLWFCATDVARVLGYVNWVILS